MLKTHLICSHSGVLHHPPVHPPNTSDQACCICASDTLLRNNRKALLCTTSAAIGHLPPGSHAKVSAVQRRAYNLTVVDKRAVWHAQGALGPPQPLHIACFPQAPAAPQKTSGPCSSFILPCLTARLRFTFACIGFIYLHAFAMCNSASIRSSK